MSNFDQVLESLRSERTTVQRELQGIESRRTQLLHDAKRIDKAIAALSGSKKKSANLKTPSFEIFRDTAFVVLEENGELTDIEFKKRIRAELKTVGHSAAGLTGFFGELLKDERIVVNQNKFSIRPEFTQNSDETS